VTLWSGCPAGQQTLCQLQWQIAGPCATTINTTSTEPPCAEIIKTVYQLATLPQLPSPAIAADGKVLSTSAYWDYAGSLALSDIHPATPEKLYEAAAAMMVLRHLWLAEGIATGHEATDQQVYARIAKNLALYPHLSHYDQVNMVPAGLDPKTYLYSPGEVQAYRDLMTVGFMRAVVLHGLRGDAQRAAAVAWMQEMLAKHPVTITGLPAFSLPEALPAVV
jgi:hypothetical protein